MPFSVWLFSKRAATIRGRARAEPLSVWQSSGFYVFANHPNHLSIMIQAPMEQRIARVMKKQGLDYEEAKKAIKNVDKMRENYVTKYTGSSRYDTRNYDLVISMNGKTEDEVVEMILSYIR